MTPARKKRLYLVTLMLIGVSIGTALAINAFKQNFLYFYSPSQITNGEAPLETLARVGGMVVEGSVERSTTDLEMSFALTDMAETVTVSYTGILPDLFREGQGIVAKGKLGQGGVFVAEEVLAKHDENYMPPEVADALEKAGKMPGTSAFGKNTVVKE